MVERQALIERLKTRLGPSIVNIAEMPNDDVLVEIRKEDVLAVMDMLKNDRTFMFHSLTNHLGVDYGESFAVVYNLYSYSLDRKITVKAHLDREHPEIDSLEPLFKGINWFERETYDLLGIIFTGHSNLTRLLLPPDWEGHPLRKDYVYPEDYGGIDNSRAGLCEETGSAE